MTTDLHLRDRAAAALRAAQDELDRQRDAAQRELRERKTMAARETFAAALSLTAEETATLIPAHLDVDTTYVRAEGLCFTTRDSRLASQKHWERELTDLLAEGADDPTVLISTRPRRGGRVTLSAVQNLAELGRVLETRDPADPDDCVAVQRRDGRYADTTEYGLALPGDVDGLITDGWERITDAAHGP